MKSILFRSTFFVAVFFFGLTLTVGAAFQEPSQPFPGGGSAAPLDTSAVSQTKSGNVTLDPGNLLFGGGARGVIQLQAGQLLSAPGFQLIPSISNQTVLNNSAGPFVVNALGFRLPNNITANITSPGAGTLIFDTAADQIKVFDGTSWGSVGGTDTSGVLTCTDTTEKVIWDATNNRFGCGTDNAGGGPGGSSQWTGSVPGNIYYNQGNVGIGTSNPLAKLEVVGDVSIIDGVNTDKKVLLGYNDGLDFAYLSAYDFDAKITKNLIFGAQNVGIGTSNPSNTLSVQGSIGLLRQSGTSVVPGPGPAIYIQSPSTAVSSVYGPSWDSCSGSSCGTDNTPDADPNNAYTCRSGDAGISYSNDLSLLGGTTQRYKNSVNCLAGTSQYSLQTNAGTLQFLNNNGTANFVVGQDGHVGIGDTSPANTLSVNGNIAWGSSEQNNLGSDQGGHFELGGMNSIANPTAGGTPYIDFHYGNGVAQDFNTRIRNSANGTLEIVAPNFYTTGRVGIGGVSSPLQPLHIGGPEAVIRMQSIGTTWGNDAGGFIEFYDKDSRGGWIGFGGGYDGNLYLKNELANKGIVFQTNGGGIVKIEDNGNVGIGTNRPVTELDVNGTIAAQRVCIGSDCRSIWDNNDDIVMEGTTLAPKYYNFDEDVYGPTQSCRFDQGGCSIVDTCNTVVNSPYTCGVSESRSCQDVTGISAGMTAGGISYRDVSCKKSVIWTE